MLVQLMQLQHVSADLEHAPQLNCAWPLHRQGTCGCAHIALTGLALLRSTASGCGLETHVVTWHVAHNTDGCPGAQHRPQHGLQHAEVQGLLLWGGEEGDIRGPTQAPDQPLRWVLHMHVGNVSGATRAPGQPLSQARPCAG
jgi:hypothetical protein